MPGHRRAPVVADDHRLSLAQRVEQADHVADQMQQRVLVDRLGPVGLAIAAHVGRDGVEAGLRRARASWWRQEYQDFGKAVAEEDQRPLALLGDVHADAVGLDGRVLGIGHGVASRARCLPSAPKSLV